MKEAMLYEKLEDKKVHCFLCRHHCRIPEGELGICSVRQNRDGTLYSLVYNKAIATNVDPIEKKPLYHYKPGTLSYSIATVGCNFTCAFCQNSDIAQMPRDHGRIAGREMPPESVVRAAKNSNCESIAYTYTEPTIFFEYAYDISVLAKEEGIGNVFVSNGYMTDEAVETIAPYLDAINVDFKAFDKEVYRTYMGANLEQMKKGVKALFDAGIWIEVTTLIVPSLNDDEKQIRGIAEFVASLSRDIPWHISRYHPSYRFMRQSPTPVKTLQHAKEIGKEYGLHYIYIGNVLGEDSTTKCPSCGEDVITRFGFHVSEKKIKNGKCAFCGSEIAGVDM